MKRFVIKANDANQRVDRFLEKLAPLLPNSLAQKYIRLKRVKVNGKAVKRDYRLTVGDALELYINDEFFDRPNEDNAYLAITSPRVDALYEDENILLALKPPGMLSHPADGEYVSTLITHIQAYLLAKNEWFPGGSETFRPALCNRIDRNTGGIVIAAKNAEALRIVCDKIREREIEKYYLAAVRGKLIPESGRLEGFIFKDAKLNRVYVREQSTAGAKSAVTEYETLAVSGNLTLLECRLITGRTHQIRAQFAAAGFPLLGDGKYGAAPQKPDNSGERYQALYSYKLRFAFKSSAGILGYLNGKTFEAPFDKIEFVTRYFGEFNNQKTDSGDIN
ncbi:MAG: RluA family pseudouridine synthase [Oscillospiraceae bacterium]|jgi:23S rRNA pseudouridine955/2504/2580 synthase|nr:RluA family pseudouridine synthase [Oscillospiraceae bacterium]